MLLAGNLADWRIAGAFAGAVAEKFSTSKPLMDFDAALHAITFFLLFYNIFNGALSD